MNQAGGVASLHNPRERRGVAARIAFKIGVKVGVRIEMEDIHWAVLCGYGSHQRKGDGMIAAERDRHSTRRQGVLDCRCHQRIVGGGRYPVFADPSKPSPEDNYRVRLGWASPSALKSSPNGTLFQNVKKRFDIDLAELGLKISDLPPPNAEQWPGLKAVVAGLKGFPVTWK